MTAYDHIERAVDEMRAQFLTVSGQIADELTRLTQHAAISPPGVRQRIITAVGQIASWQQQLHTESERLPSDPQDRHAIMRSVLQAQQGALHHLVIIVRQHAPGWHPNLTNMAAWQSSAPEEPWSAGPAAGGELNGSSEPAPLYPSPPTVQDLATHGWPQTQGNGGYPTDMQAPTHQPAWPMGNAGTMVPYANAGSSQPSVHAPWPGRRGHTASPGPSPYEPRYETRELRPARTHTHATTLPATRRRSDLVAAEPGSNNLLWVGLAVLALIFVYLSFPWEIRQREAVAERPVQGDATASHTARSASQVEMSETVSESPAAPQQTRVIARASEVEASAPAEPSTSASAASGIMVLPGGFVDGHPNVAIGTLPSEQSGDPSIGREPSQSNAAPAEPEPPPAPAARPKQRTATAPARAEPEAAPPPAVQAAPRRDQFVAVLFTHRSEPTVTKTFAALRQQYPQVLGNRKVESQSVRIAKKGVWHRLVVLPAGPREDAANLCGELMGAGYTRCWVKPYKSY